MAADTLADKYVRRALTLIRASEGEANEAAKLFNEMNKKIVRLIKQSGFGVITKGKLKSLERVINREINKFYGSDFPQEIKDAAFIAVEKEIAWNVSVIADESAKELNVPRNKAVVKRAATKTYQGKKISTWVKREHGKYSKQVNNALKTGFIESQSLSEVEANLSFITGRSRRDVRTIARSSFMHNAAEAKNSVFAINPDIVEGVVWISTLDNRTTPLLCGIRDGKEYDQERNPVDHNLPWDAGPGRLHWNCRSTSVPLIIGVPRSGTRPSIDAGADYEKGDSTTRTGRVRKPTKVSREKGIYKVSQHTTKTKYEGWLREQSRHNIDFVSDVLGNKNARAFRDGEVTLFELGLESPVARPINRNSI